MANQTKIKQLFIKARRILRNPSLDLLIAPAISKGTIFVITPRHLGTAVERNTIRRRIKALAHDEKLAQKGFDLVIIVKKKGIEASYDQLKEIILNAFKVTIHGEPVEPSFD